MEEAIERIKSYFDPFIKTELNDWAPLMPYFKKRTITTRGIIKNAGDREESLRFILKGAGAIFMVQEDRDVCFNICLENEFLTDFWSLITGEPKHIYIRNFEHMELVVIDRPEFIRFYTSSALGAHLGRILAEQQNLKSEFRHQVSHGTAKERYRRLSNKWPDILLRVPLRHIASYLGVSPESLSRLRGRRE